MNAIAGTISAATVTPAPMPGAISSSGATAALPDISSPRRLRVRTPTATIRTTPTMPRQGRAASA